MTWTFISYHHEGESPYAWRLYDYLRQRLGPDAVFIDEASLLVGEKLEPAIKKGIARCKVFIPVIGPDWVSPLAGSGRPEHPSKFVVLEYREADKLKKKISPVLVGGAEMPNQRALKRKGIDPGKFKGVELDNKKFRDGVDELIRAFPGVRRKNPNDGLFYRFIKPCFELDKHAVRRVSIDTAFWMSETPITVEAYQRFVVQTKHRQPEKPRFQQESSHPVIQVSWEDAWAYCDWTGGRLPRESEWQYAAAPEGRGYSPLADHAWCGKQKWEGTAPVGKLKPNRCGLKDVLGNVWEWCEDVYTNPDGKQVLPEHRAVRGGGWSSTDVGVWMRDKFHYASTHDDVGFRCVLPPLALG